MLLNYLKVPVLAKSFFSTSNSTYAQYYSVKTFIVLYLFHLNCTTIVINVYYIYGNVKIKKIM